MSISVSCSECDEVYHVSDDKFGKKIRCRQCGAIVPITDDSMANADEVSVRRPKSTRQRKQSKNSNQTPWLLIGGITAAVVLVIAVAVSLIGGSLRSNSGWVSDPLLEATLDREVNLNGYAIRPPRDWPVTYSETNGAIPSVKYSWRSRSHDEQFELVFYKDARYHPAYQPQIVTRPGAFGLDFSRDVYLHEGSTHDQGTINGQKFHRIFSPKQFVPKVTSAQSIYITYLPGIKVELHISCGQGESSSSFKTLEMAALSFRVGLPSDPSAVPIQQRLLANPNVVPNIPNNAAPNAVASNRPNGNQVVSNNANRLPPVIAPNQPPPLAPPVNNLNKPTVIKSGEIPTLANLLEAKGGAFSYFYQRPELPGVYHIYPNEAYQPKIVIPLLSDTASLTRPITASDFLMVGSQVWNVKSGELAATLKLKVDRSDLVAISPDGKLVAHRERGKEESPIAIFSTVSQSQTVELAARKGDARLIWIGFLDPTRLMLVWNRWNKTNDNAVQIWDANSGEGLSAFGLAAFDQTKMTVSSDGERLLYVTNDAAWIVSLSQKNSKPAQLPIPDRLSLIILNGLAISPDNGRAAAYRNNGDGISLLEWDLQKKKIVQNGSIPLNTSDIAFNGQADSFEWTANNDRWLLKGHLLLDSKSGNPLWRLQPLSAMYTPPVMIDQETLLVPVQSKSRESFLVSVPFPWDKIRRATEAMNDRSQPALLRPGASVSMEFNPGPLRFMAADQMAQVLGQPIAERLKSFGIKVEPNQPTVLYIKYQEQTGDSLKVVEKKSPFDFVGTPTGQTVNETRYELELGWKQSGTDRIFWKTTSRGSTPRSGSIANLSDQGLHEDMVKSLKRQLNNQVIPYFIPEDESVPLLPVISTR